MQMLSGLCGVGELISVSRSPGWVFWNGSCSAGDTVLCLIEQIPEITDVPSNFFYELKWQKISPYKTSIA